MCRRFGTLCLFRPHSSCEQEESRYFFSSVPLNSFSSRTTWTPLSSLRNTLKNVYFYVILGATKKILAENMSYCVMDQLRRNVFMRKSARQTWNWEKSIDFVLILLLLPLHLFLLFLFLLFLLLFFFFFALLLLFLLPLLPLFFFFFFFLFFFFFFFFFFSYSSSSSSSFSSSPSSFSFSFSFSSSSESWGGETALTRFRNRKAFVELAKHQLSADIHFSLFDNFTTVLLPCNVFTPFMIRHCWPFEGAQEITSRYIPLYVRISYDFPNKYSRQEHNGNYKRHYLSKCADYT